MRLRCRVAISGMVISLTLASAALAEEPVASVVWYRASEQCPSGPEFLGRLSSVPGRARLAEGGDHIDFVVTLVAGHDATVGRLERQTQSGTVAIRELRDVSCQRVADALALSLGLALGPTPSLSGSGVPGAATPAGAEAPKPAQAAAPEPVSSAEPTPPAPAPPVPTPALVPAAHPAAETRPVSAPSRPPRRWSIGLDAGAVFGVAPSALGRGAAFVEVDHALASVASDLSLRFALVAALGSPATAVGPVRQWIAAGRGEVCPWRWGGARVGLRPCAAFELGATGASEVSSTRPSRESASSAWVAPGVGLRASVFVLPELGLEAGADALFPLARSEVDAGGAQLYQSEVIAIFGYVGVSVGPF